MNDFPSALIVGQDTVSPDARTRTPLWLLTFTDMTGILLSFFIMIHATTTPQVDSWPFPGTGGNPASQPAAGVPATQHLFSPQPVPPAREARVLDPGFLAVVLERGLREEKRLEKIAARVILQREAGRIIIILDTGAFFPGGLPGMLARREALAHVLAGGLRYAANPVRIHVQVPGSVVQGRLGENSQPELLREPAVALGFERASALGKALEAAGYQRPVAMISETTADRSERVFIEILARKGAGL